MKLRALSWRALLLSLILQTPIHLATIHAAQGLRADYYAGFNLEENTGTILLLDDTYRKKIEIDQTLDHWNGSEEYDWTPIDEDAYTVRWKGRILAPENGLYGIGTISDDGSQAWIDGQMVLNNGEAQWYDWQEAFVFLTSGTHDFELRFYDAGAYSGIELWWLLPSRSPSSLPYFGDTFFTEPPTRNQATKWQIIPAENFSNDLPVPFPLVCSFDPVTQEFQFKWFSAKDAIYDMLTSDNFSTWQSLGQVHGNGDWIVRSRKVTNNAGYFRVVASPN